MGIKPVLLSGDKKDICLKVAAAIGIKEVHAEMLPDEKLKVIDMYKQKGKTIMIGDGINDAPALTKADVGVSYERCQPGSHTIGQCGTVEYRSAFGY
jgi:Cu+-exporting ATPase